jgi:hypothetical protein
MRAGYASRASVKRRAHYELADFIPMIIDNVREI